MAVNIEKGDIGFEGGAWSWFQSFRDRAMAKVDTGQNLGYCVQLLGSLLGVLWDYFRLTFGYKQGSGF